MEKHEDVGQKTWKINIFTEAEVKDWMLWVSLICAHQMFKRPKGKDPFRLPKRIRWRSATTAPSRAAAATTSARRPRKASRAASYPRRLENGLVEDRWKV